MSVHVLMNDLLFSGVFCAAQETRSDHLPAHLPPFLHALDVVVGRELCTRWAILLPIWVSEQIFTWMAYADSVDVTCLCALTNIFYSSQTCFSTSQDLLHVLMVFVNKVLMAIRVCCFTASALTFKTHCNVSCRWNGLLPCHDQLLCPCDHVLLLRPFCCRASLPKVPLVEEVHDCNSAGMFILFVEQNKTHLCGCWRDSSPWNLSLFIQKDIFEDSYTWK